MLKTTLNMIRVRGIGHALLAIVTLWNVTARADVVIHYAIDADSSVIHTSGGISGGGFGDLTIDGSFDIRLFEPSSPLATIFENIAVSSSPASAFEFPAYIGIDSAPGNLTAYIQLGTQSNPSGFPSNHYTATLNQLTHQLTIVGTYYEPFADGFIYDYTIHTTIVPEPSTAMLLALGIAALAGTRGCQNIQHD